MASSGTISLTVDTVIRPGVEKGRVRGTLLSIGRARIKNSAIIEAEALELRTIKTFIAMPYFTEATPPNVKSPISLYGSVHVAGSLMNRVTVLSLKGSVNPVTGGVGTAHIGTIVGGTVQFSFYAVGE